MARNSRKEKWRNVSINPSNIDDYLIDLIEDTKGQYITQGVSFNKDDSFQMGLLKHAILDHSSFSGLVKHLLTLYFSGQTFQSPNSSAPPSSIAFHHTREIQETVAEAAATQEIHKPSSASPVVARRTQAQVQAPDSSKTQGQRKRTTPRRPSGGGFLQANPNAKLPTDPSAN
ncbi:hypothetical protein AAXB25_14740 [Paenibacillus lautus]|uniref:hypothetical protein n=1 Tax=Paenibacillus lautus TaxID=1401 RepID=UPI003D270586